MTHRKISPALFWISPGTYLYLALLVLLLPLQWLFAIAVSAAVHELGHLLAMVLQKLPIHGISVFPSGVRIRTQPLNDMQELICAAAGPMCGACLVILVEWFPGLALISAFHSLYNLLPVYPADGGRILRCLSKLLLPGRIADMLTCAVQWGTVSLVLLLGCYAAFVLKLGLLPLLVGIAMALGALKCK